MFPKPSRVINPKALKDVRNRPCMICNKWPSDAHHVTTKGAGGGDTYDNLANLCRTHHTECHQIGTHTFMTKYKQFKEWCELYERYDILHPEWNGINYE